MTTETPTKSGDSTKTPLLQRPLPLAVFVLLAAGLLYGLSTLSRNNCLAHAERACGDRAFIEEASLTQCSFRCPSPASMD